MSKLSSAQRNSLPDSAFAGPNRSLPINDATHARKALQLGPRAVKSGSISRGAFVKAKATVHKKFPDIGRKSQGDN